MPYNRFALFAAAGVAASIASALAFSGCHNSGPSITGAGGAALNPDEVVATVNGEKITTAQMYDSMAHYIPQQLPQFPQNQMLAESASKVALQFLIENSVVTQLAKDKNVPVTQGEIDSQYGDLKMIEETRSTKPFEQGLTEDGYTPDSFKAEVITPQVARFNLLTNGITATDSELQAYYNENIAQFQTESRAHVEMASFMDKATADAAYTSAVTTGSLNQFASKSTQPEIDYPNWINLDHADKLPPALVAALKSSKAGDVLKPMNLGEWIVIRVVEKRPAETKKFADVKHLVMTNLLESRARSSNGPEYQSDIAEAITKGDITTTKPEFKSVIQDLKSSSKAVAAGGNGAGAGGSVQPVPDTSGAAPSAPTSPN